MKPSCVWIRGYKNESQGRIKVPLTNLTSHFHKATFSRSYIGGSAIPWSTPSQISKSDIMLIRSKTVTLFHLVNSSFGPLQDTHWQRYILAWDLRFLCTLGLCVFVKNFFIYIFLQIFKLKNYKNLGIVVISSVENETFGFSLQRTTPVPTQEWGKFGENQLLFKHTVFQWTNIHLLWWIHH